MFSGGQISRPPASPPSRRTEGVNIFEIVILSEAKDPCSSARFNDLRSTARILRRLEMRRHSERSEESRPGLFGAIRLTQSKIPRGVYPEHPRARSFAALRMTAKGSE
jgi:hypothetical protein